MLPISLNAFSCFGNLCLFLFIIGARDAYLIRTFSRISSKHWRKVHAALTETYVQRSRPKGEGREVLRAIGALIQDDLEVCRRTLLVNLILFWTRFKPNTKCPFTPMFDRALQY